MKGGLGLFDHEGACAVQHRDALTTATVILRVNEAIHSATATGEGELPLRYVQRMAAEKLGEVEAPAESVMAPTE